ncbi:signal recognition particle protein [Mitosporidium daphniae]|uniref:signal-recognition-particle GTPase n=1 Tax=Mitosporidium daphniae TaxID=1485682 RepID=A0A098VQG7_9MICR|nr:signal recognition particle protein [Mitosporidium daphniae]KGG51220.1 signal recognition particle protein [Mitosporidium daphniae]|eukprot:XP_013237665.1 signal recognition particle protein [Mitosporidium daphniae]
MVLNDLGRSLRDALAGFNRAPNPDQKAIDALMNDVCRALIGSDVNIAMVKKLRTNVLASIETNLGSGAVIDELCSLIDPGIPPWQPRRGHRNVVMFVGLQGSGKTTSCTKKGFKVGLVCADTFRAGAYDQLRQNATKARIPYFGSYSEPDPVKIALQGLQKFTQEKFELIIVDTSGRHAQETSLFQEMVDIETAVCPDNVVFIMDGSIGQVADSQARAFKSAVNVGSIFLTKMDGHAKGGGALSGVAATGCPIVFIGTGEHVDDIERFSVRPFISKLLGMGDIGGLIEKVQDIRIDSAHKDLQKHIEQGIFSLSDLQELFSMISGMGPLSNILNMLPGGADLMAGPDIGLRMRRYMTLLDSMHSSELSADARIFSTQPGRARRVCAGSGCDSTHLAELLEQHKKFAALIKQMGGPKGLLKNLSGTNHVSNSQQMAKMSRFVPPELLQSMGNLVFLSYQVAFPACKI